MLKHPLRCKLLELGPFRPEAARIQTVDRRRPNSDRCSATTAKFARGHPADPKASRTIDVRAFVKQIRVRRPVRCRAIWRAPFRQSMRDTLCTPQEHPSTCVAQCEFGGVGVLPGETRRSQHRNPRNRNTNNIMVFVGCILLVSGSPQEKNTKQIQNRSRILFVKRDVLVFWVSEFVMQNFTIRLCLEWSRNGLLTERRGRTKNSRVPAEVENPRLVTSNFGLPKNIAG